MKTLKIVLMSAGVLVLAGCGNKTAQNSNDTAVNETEIPKVEEKSAASGVISSMQDAMASGKAMKCEYTIKDKDGKGLTATAYVEGGKYMTTMEIAGNTQKMIFDETAMYSWGEGQKTGMKMTTACSEELAANVPQGETKDAPVPVAPDAEKTFDGATDVKGEPFSDADFSVPSDVTFTDQCEMMKNLMKNIPSGAGIPKMPSGSPSGAAPAMPY